jgi:hypothetical protein
VGHDRQQQNRCGQKEVVELIQDAMFEVEFRRDRPGRS